MLCDLCNGGLEGRDLQLIVTDGRPGLTAAIPVTSLIREPGIRFVAESTTRRGALTN